MRPSLGYWVGVWLPSFAPLCLSPGCPTLSHLDLCPLCPEKSAGTFFAESLFLDLVQMISNLSFSPSYCSFLQKISINFFHLNFQWKRLFPLLLALHKCTIRTKYASIFLNCNLLKNLQESKRFNWKIPLNTFLILLNSYIPSIHDAEV